MLLQDKIELIRIVIFISVTIIVLLLFVFVLILNYQKKQIQHTKNLENLEKESELRLLKTELQVQETTFQHISREIHDNIGQKLTLVKLNLSNLNAELTHVNHQQMVAEVSDMLTIALNDLRDLSRSMSSDMIKQNGLMKAIEFELQQINKAGRFNIRLVVKGDVPFMESDVELTIFRIIQESLSNIMKHAEATQITVQISCNNTSLEFEVEDNGCGIDLSGSEHFGNGLKNIHARAIALKGNVKLISDKGKGTTVRITIPTT